MEKAGNVTEKEGKLSDDPNECKNPTGIFRLGKETGRG